MSSIEIEGTVTADRAADMDTDADAENSNDAGAAAASGGPDSTSDLKEDHEQIFEGFRKRFLAKSNLGKLLEEIKKVATSWVNNNNVDVETKCNLLALRHKIDEEINKPSLDHDVSRVAEIELGIRDSEYIPTSDLDRFSERVKDLFKWHDESPAGGVKSHSAPLLPMIQSSGVGKTKLMFEFREKEKNNSNRRTLLILCANGKYDGDPATTIYDNILSVPQGISADTRVDTLEKLEDFKKAAMVDHLDTSNRQVLLLFDEAQHLLDNDGFAFRCIRWWLRRKDHNVKIAAVFTGTNSGLANFYLESPKQTKSSRDADSPYHEYEAKMYEPFYDFCTTGCLLSRAGCNTTDRTDFENAIPYGRPLFVKMKDLSEKLPDILKRMLLSASPEEWQKRQASIVSILATRVQLGYTATCVVSALVSKGYAHLTDFTRFDDDKIPGSQQGIADFCYFTDPVCVHLAMCLMTSGFTSTTMLGGYKAKDPSFWTEKAMEIFSSGLCKPNKGDLGEIGAALYLLFCGDSMRFRLNPKLTTFAVPFEEWLNVLKDPSLVSNPSFTMASGRNVDMISFVQIRRLHLRMPLEELITQDFLRHLYVSGTACYLYEACPVFDIIASIRSKGGTYKALLISVKARQKLYNSAELPKMKETCDSLQVRSEAILFAIGRKNRVDQMAPTGTSHVVDVPLDDPFGVSNLVLSTTANKERAEIFASHDFIRSIPDDDESCLRLSNRPNPDHALNYLKAIRLSFRDAPPAVSVQEQSGVATETTQDTTRKGRRARY
jgi:AAA domain